MAGAEPRAASAVVVVPVLLVLTIASASHLLAWASGDIVWAGRAPIGSSGLAIEAVLPVLVAAAGGELGWRGWLQPRLDRAGIRGSLPMVAVLETLAYIPAVLVLARTAGPQGSDPGAALFLFGAMRVGSVPLLAWLVYRSRSAWSAVIFRSTWDLLVPAVGATLFVLVGEPWMAGTSGVAPIIAHSAAALGVFGLMWHRGGSWSAFARWSLRRASD